MQTLPQCHPAFLMGATVNLTVISIHVPTPDAEKEVRVLFYDYNYALPNRLVASNTRSKHPQRHFKTWSTNDGHTRIQFDQMQVRARCLQYNGENSTCTWRDKQRGHCRRGRDGGGLCWYKKTKQCQPQGGRFGWARQRPPLQRSTIYMR